jgi:hypothetical protein
MSDETMDAVLSEPGIDADLTWDNVEVAAPSIADGETSKPEGMDDEWNNLGSEDNAAETKDEDTESDKQESDNPDSEAESVEEVAEPDGEESEEVSESNSEENADEVKPLNIEEMPDDTKLMVKVDGELQEITLKEYKNGISGLAVRKLLPNALTNST